MVLPTQQLVVSMLWERHVLAATISQRNVLNQVLIAKQNSILQRIWEGSSRVFLRRPPQHQRLAGRGVPSRCRAVLPGRTVALSPPQAGKCGNPRIPQPRGGPGCEFSRQWYPPVKGRDTETGGEEKKCRDRGRGVNG